MPSGLAGVAVAVAIEPIVIFADDRDRGGVLRPVAATTFAVIVGGVGIQAGAAVVRVAFGGFFAFFRFALFPLFGFGLTGFRVGSPTSRFSAYPPPRGFMPRTHSGAMRFADPLSFPLLPGGDPRFERGALARFAFTLRLGI